VFDTLIVSNKQYFRGVNTACTKHYAVYSGVDTTYTEQHDVFSGDQYYIYLALRRLFEGGYFKS